MGKMSLILTMGIAVIIGFFVLRLNTNAKEGLSTTLDMYEYTQARLIANSGVEIYLEKMRRNKTLNSGTFLDNELADGTYDIYITGPDTALNIRSVATFYECYSRNDCKSKKRPGKISNTACSIVCFNISRYKCKNDW